MKTNSQKIPASCIERSRNTLRLCGEKKAFTLIELLVTLSIIAIISAVVIPNFTGSQKKAKDDNAVARGSVLDIAKTTLMQENPNAKNLWLAADALDSYNPDPPTATGNLSARDEAKYNLLRPYLSAPPSGTGPVDYGLGNGFVRNKYSPMGYHYHIEDLNGPTVVHRNIDNTSLGSSGGANKRTITLIANPIGGGTVFGARTYTVGEPVTIKAEEFQNYAWAGWSDGNMSRVRSFNMPDSDVSYTANFTASGPGSVSYTILASPGGTTTPVAGTYTINKGSSTPAVSANPDTANGYTFDHWYFNGSDAGTSGTLSGRVINSNSTIRPTFKKGTVTVNFAIASGSPWNNSGGTIAATSGSYPSGSKISATATPKSGYFFYGWWDGSAFVSQTSDPTNCINAPLSLTVTADVNKTLYACFQAKKTFSVWSAPGTNQNWNDATGGTVDPIINTYELQATHVFSKDSTFTQTAWITADTYYIEAFKVWDWDANGWYNPRNVSFTTLSTYPYGIASASCTVSVNPQDPTKTGIVVMPIFKKSSLGTITNPPPPTPTYYTLTVEDKLHRVAYWYDPWNNGFYLSQADDVPYSGYTRATTSWGDGYWFSYDLIKPTPMSYSVAAGTPVPINTFINQYWTDAGYWGSGPPQYGAYGFTYSGNLFFTYTFQCPYVYQNSMTNWSGDDSKCYLPSWELQGGWAGYVDPSGTIGAGCNYHISTWTFSVNGNSSVKFWCALTPYIAD